MRTLLDATVPYIGRFKGIRISTRPDCIDGEVLELLKAYHVTTIELGAQSMDDTVLLANDRGHTAADVRRASELIKAHGFDLGLQMMTGLYQSTPDSDLQTAQEFILLQPSCVRIYPTIVMRGTRLGELYEQGVYQPQTLEEAVALCARLIRLFEEKDARVRVIRVGLHDSESLKENRLAGPYHPAFKELCESRIMLDRAISLLRQRDAGKYTLRVSPQCRSKMTGNKKSNLLALKERGYEIQITEDDRLSYLEVKMSPPIKAVTDEVEA